MYEGLSGSISLDGYKDDQKNTWQIDADCESLLIKSTLFDTEYPEDRFYIEEEGIITFHHSGDKNMTYTTNTGNVVLAFASDYIYRQCFKKFIFYGTSSF